MTATTTPAAPVTPTPKNGATQQQQPSSQPPPATAAPTIEEREAALAKKEQAYAAEMKKFTASKGGLGAKLSEYEKLKKTLPDVEREREELKKWRAEREAEDEMFALNPEPKLKRLLGDNYYDKLMQFRINGVPPADLIAARVSEIERKFEQKLADRDAQAKTADEQRTQQEEAETRRMVAHNCTTYFEQKTDEYPLLSTYGDAKRIGDAVAKYIEQEFLKDGRTLLTPQEACEKLEAAEYVRLEKASASPKYAPKLQEKLKPATVPASSQSGSGAQGESQSQRRTLSTHLTASTPQAQAPRRTDAEREAAAIAKFNEVRSRSKA